MSKNLTKDELLKKALEKGYFGDSEILFACEDGNMWAVEEDAKSHCVAKEIEYFMLSKKAEKTESKEPSKGK